MKLILNGRYKLLSAFETEDLTDFCVITCKNGSGKTQLLELIRATVKEERHDKDVTLKIVSQPVDPQFEGLEVKNGQYVENKSWRERVDVLSQQFLSLRPDAKSFLMELVENGLTYQNVIEGFQLEDFLSPERQAPVQMQTLVH